MNDFSEISGSNKLHEEFNKWADRLEKMDDMAASREIYNRIMNHSDLTNEDKELLKDSYDYCMRLMRQGKKLEPDLLRIYLDDIKGYQISQLNIVNLIVLLGCCGIVFTT